MARSIVASCAPLESRTMKTQNLFGPDELARLGPRSDADMRPTLLRVLTDLYVQQFSHTPDEERHYTELALRLLETVDLPTRVAVARRFASYGSPPLRVLQRLAGDLPAVSAELRAHPLLQPPVGIVSESCLSPAGQATEQVVPPDDTPPPAASRGLDPTIAAELNEQFFAANAEERRLILLNLHLAAPAPAGSVTISRDPSVSQRLETAALGGKREAFARELAAALRIPPGQAQRVTRDELGEPVVVAAKAVAMSSEVLYRVLLFINPKVGHSVERVRALAALNEEMASAAAESLVTIWQALEQREPLGKSHQPLTWDDETRRRARPAATLQGSPAAPRRSDRRAS
jgi:hypothetical protein